MYRDIYIYISYILINDWSTLVESFFITHTLLLVLWSLDHSAFTLSIAETANVISIKTKKPQNTRAHTTGNTESLHRCLLEVTILMRFFIVFILK